MRAHLVSCLVLFFFNDTATTEIYTLSLHDALPIWTRRRPADWLSRSTGNPDETPRAVGSRSEEHTSELQSRLHLVCRLLLEKKKGPKRANPQKARPSLVSGALDTAGRGLHQGTLQA